MIVKTLEEIIEEIDEDYIFNSSFKPKLFALKVAKEIRRLTLEEVNNVAEVTIVDSEYDSQLDRRVPIYGVDSSSILNLDLEKIQTW